MAPGNFILSASFLILDDHLYTDLLATPRVDHGMLKWEISGRN
jgi:hypothetical protein